MSYELNPTCKCNYCMQDDTVSLISVSILLSLTTITAVSLPLNNQDKTVLKPFTGMMTKNVSV